MSAQRDYWFECVQTAAEDCGAILSQEQSQYIAEAVQGSHENYGMAFYQPESPLPGRIKELERELKIERSKIGCPKCKGRGRLEYGSGPWWVNTECDRCGGEGKVLP